MQKTLVLAEKPSVGRDLARVLGCKEKGSGYFEGREYIVTWALGHLVTLAEPEDYDKKYKSWRMEDLPILPARPKLVVIKQSGRQFSCVRQQMQRKDVGQVVIATDAGREGELVARWIIEKAGVRKPIKRLWISSVTDRAIKEGFKALRDGKDYENLYASAVARAEADWLVGINATRALACKYNAQLSCGRVQTPTLAIIAKREQEIQDFVPRPYYGINAVSDKFKLTWQDLRSGSFRTFDREVRDSVLESMQGKDAVVIQADKTLKKNFAPLLYDLTELQRDANRTFGYSAKETLSIMQSLYERHKVLTYPRTDSKHISTDIVGTLKERIKTCGVGPYSKAAARAGKSHITDKLHFVDNGKVSDHHAIIPTEQTVYLDDMSERERRIYGLVVKRFLAAFYPPFEYQQVTIKAKVGDQALAARGKVIVTLGWKEVYQNEIEEKDADGEVPEQALPDIRKGDTIKILRLEKTEKNQAAIPVQRRDTAFGHGEPGKVHDRRKRRLDKDHRRNRGFGNGGYQGGHNREAVQQLSNRKERKGYPYYLKGQAAFGIGPRGSEVTGADRRVGAKAGCHFQGQDKKGGLYPTNERLCPGGCEGDNKQQCRIPA